MPAQFRTQPVQESANPRDSAGGITGTRAWQADACSLLHAAVPEAVLLNPRRASFDLASPAMAAEQVEWEQSHLHSADVVLFYFPDAGQAVPQPIAWYELGQLGRTTTPIVVGCDAAYPRRGDLELQMHCARPGLRVHTDLDDVVKETAAVVAKLQEACRDQ